MLMNAVAGAKGGEMSEGAANIVEKYSLKRMGIDLVDTRL